MEILILSFYCILLWYLLNILWLIVGFSKMDSYKFKSTPSKTQFSIVVPFRNEINNLPQLLDSFEKLNYPKDFFEIILVDDASTDGWKLGDFPFEVKVIENIRKTNSPKKDAINTAITVAKQKWILTTDADCIVPVNWLACLDAFIQQENPEMIASGVIYDSKNNFLETFQQMDLLSLQGTTIGSFGNQQSFMCNGANFCYKKSFFQELQGFDGNDFMASGDDVFLLQKGIQKKQKEVHFLKSNETTVKTQPEKTWKSLFNQRIRWASKTQNYNTFYSKQLGLSVFFINLILVVLVGTSCFFSYGFQLLIWLFLIKFLIDFILLKQASSYFKQPLNYLFFCSLWYPFFCVTVVVHTLLGTYYWKDRIFKK